MKKLLPITLALAASTALPSTLLAQDSGTPAETERDRSMIVGFLEDNLSGAGRDIRIEGFKGLLASSATLDTLTIADDQGVWFTLKGAELDWSRAALLSGRVEVTRIAAKEILFDRLPDAPQTTVDIPAPEATPFSLPDLPVSIDIGAIEAERVRLGAPVLKIGEAVEISLSGSAQLADGSGQTALDITRLDGTTGQFSLAASFDNATEQLDLDLSLSEGEGGIVTTLANLPGAPSLSLVAKGSGPLDGFATDIALSTDGQERLTGRVALSAEPDPDQSDAPAPRRFTADLSGDLTPLFSPDYAQFFGDASLLSAKGLSYPQGGFDLESFILSTRTLLLTGALDLAADGLPNAFDLSGTLVSPDGEPVLLPFGNARSRVHDAAIRAAYDIRKGESWTADIDLTQYAQDGLSLDQAALAARGTISRRRSSDGATLLGAVKSRFSLTTRDLAFDDPALQQAVGATPGLTGRLSWREGRPLALEALEIQSSDTTATLSGSLDGLSDGLGFTGKLGLDTPDLSRFAALSGQNLSGALTAAAQGRIAPLNGTFDLDIDATGNELQAGIAELDALTGGRSAISLSAKRDGTGVSLQRAFLSTTALMARARGQLSTEAGDLNLSARLDEAARLGLGLSGPLSVTLDMSRTGADSPWQTDAELDGLGGTSAQLNGALKGLESGDLNALAFDGTLALDAPQLAQFSTLAGRPLSGALNASAKGSVTPLTGLFDLDVAATGTNLRSGIAQLDALTGGTSTLSLSAKRDESGLTLRQADLATPALQAQAETTFAAESAEITVTARLDDVARLGVALSGPLSLDAQLSHSGTETPWQAAANMTGPGGTAAQMSGALAQDFATADLSLTGTAPLGLSNRFTTAALTQGNTTFDLRLNGPLGLNAVSGQAQIVPGGRAVISSAGLALTVERGLVTLNGGQAQLDFAASADTGGSLTTSGPITLSGAFPASLAIGINQLGLSDPQLYSTSLDGNLRFEGGLTGGGQISGALTLGKTDVTVSPAALGSGGDIPAITHRGASAKVQSTRDRAGLIAEEKTGGPGASYGLDLTISAPSQIFIRGRGLDAEMGGQLRLRGTTTDVVPVGQFSLIRGRLSLLGKRIVMEEGAVTLQGELDPMMRLVAVTETDDLTVQLITEGPVSSPELTLTSSPVLPQDEILARLLFGKSLSEISALQAAQMAAAVATLTGGGGGLVGSIRDSFGLDDLDLQTSEEGGSSLKLGKYISDSVYTDVTIDNAGKTQINLNFDATRNVTIKGTATSDGDTGFGVFFEKDY
ncbi:translocation/assembly module TamB domain-containing protein [Celeribacter neptunius]|uniref:Autotransporter secretion inner membrane protein TamB n=1 Tax=Celeribacter neptunius TaxID=588602 RepID=A0A1I3VBK5_9RHOB|nr:translocation/assembly module TamB domain-containing protein [Celeribacter neptunius]SFJ92393.1 autotransporter secretion inner membrane protein TamB [Celeribacter neptunius]